MNINNIYDLLRRLYMKATTPPLHGSGAYWERRYSEGGNSGTGSYAHFARFKADVVNSFVERNGIETVVEFGCGDGNQLTYATYPEYTGVDVSHSAVARCNERFADDPHKRFVVYAPGDGQVFRADLVLSMEVIFHLVEDETFRTYMDDLFQSSNLYVVIYSSNHDGPLEYHVRHRAFMEYIIDNITGYELVETIGNRYSTSPSDFYIFKRT